MFLLVALLALFFRFSEASTSQYPVDIKEFGGFFVKNPLVTAPPPDAVVFPRQKKLKLKYLILNGISVLELCSNLVSEHQISELIDGRGSITDGGIALVISFKHHCDSMNPSILEGIEDPVQILVFGAVFLRLFKAAYPGLRDVQMSKEKIAHLVSYAIHKFAKNRN